MDQFEANVDGARSWVQDHNVNASLNTVSAFGGINPGKEKPPINNAVLPLGLEESFPSSTLTNEL